MRDGSPSDTATLVARSILLASQDGILGRLVAPGEAEATRRILESLSGGAWFDFALRHAAARRLLISGERWLLPGIIAHYMVRKRRIEMVVREAIASGARQVLVVAAGFDTLAWRLHTEFPSVRFVELDHPATQRPKREALAEGPNLEFASLDLTRESLLGTMAGDSGLRESLPSVVVIEGLTMYLDVSHVASLIAEAAEVAGNTGKIVVTFMERAEDGSIGFRGESPLIGRWLEARREPFLWGATRAELRDLLAEAGVDCLAVIDDVEMREQVLDPRGLGDLPLARGECVCIASRHNDGE